jgi:serine/threonine protein kinase
MIGKTIHHFRILSQIGEGGMGVVYVAEHLRFPKRVAIKVLSKSLSGDPHLRSRFYGEAQKQAILDHPNIVQATDFFEAEGQFFLVMEYVDGPDLGKLIKAKGKLPEEEALPILQDILRGLAYAHSKGLVHRDIKPSNVLIDGEGRARIMDFGIAILAGGAEKRLTATGATIGSPWYMSPEQIRNPKELDCRTDIYAVGIVLYEMLVGDVPFDGETDYIIQSQHIDSPPPDLHKTQPDISQELAQIVHTALAKDPAERFQNCLEFRKRIQEYERKKATPVTTPGPRFPKWVAAAAVVVALALGAIFMAPSQPPDVPKPPPNETPQHEIAYDLIQTASVQASVICRELETVKRKREGLQIAREIDTSTTEALIKQIEDLDKNIDKAVPKYRQLISRLSALNSGIVDDEANHYAGDLTKKSEYKQIQMIRMTKRHYERYRAGETGVDVHLMRRDCEQESKGV